MQEKVKKLASNLLNHSVSLKRGEKILIEIKTYAKYDLIKMQEVDAYMGICSANPIYIGT